MARSVTSNPDPRGVLLGALDYLDEVEELWVAGAHCFCERPSIRATFPNLKHTLLIDPGDYTSCDDDETRIVVAVGSRMQKHAPFTLTSNQGGSDSLLHFDSHNRQALKHINVKETGTTYVNVVTLEWLRKEFGRWPDAMLMDIQGMEHETLSAAPDELFKHLKLLETEVMFTSLYEGQGLFTDLYWLLKEKMDFFGCIAENFLWGNAVWIQRRRGE